MYTQKLYKNGNSVAVTIPKELLLKHELRDGSQVVVTEHPDTGDITITRKVIGRKKVTLSPKFMKWLEKFNQQYGSALEELARK